MNYIPSPIIYLLTRNNRLGYLRLAYSNSIYLIGETDFRSNHYNQTATAVRTYNRVRLSLGFSQLRFKNGLTVWPPLPLSIHRARVLAAAAVRDCTTTTTARLLRARGTATVHENRKPPPTSPSGTRRHRVSSLASVTPVSSPAFRVHCVSRTYASF